MEFSYKEVKEGIEVYDWEGIYIETLPNDPL